MSLRTTIEGKLAALADFFVKHPGLHKAAHLVFAAVAFLLFAPSDEIAKLTEFLPGSVTTHRYFGFALALLTFTRFFVRQAQAFGSKPDAAAPQVPASEAVTKVERVNPEKSK